MADEEDLDDEPPDEEGGDLDDEDDDDSSEGDGSGKRRLLIVIAAVLLLAVGGIAAAYFTGLLEPIIEMIRGDVTKDEKEPTATTKKKDAIFFPLEEMIVNLNTGGRRSSFLKIRVSLELDTANDVQRIESVMPRVLDNFQVYLRELRIEDLKGSAGMYRLREELLTRVNAAAAPAKVNDILFKEMLVQ